MDCIIGNQSEERYIRIDDGKIISCPREKAQHFDYTKAINIRNNMPKSLKNITWNIIQTTDDDPVKLEIKEKPSSMRMAKKDSEWQTEETGDTRKIYLKSTTYEVPKKVYEWADRVKDCDSLVTDAVKRKEELKNALEENNKELTNVQHTIELESKRNMYDGYRYYLALRETLIDRRHIKDELTIVETIATMNDYNTRQCNRQVEDDIRHMANRRFEFRKINKKGEA